jgi:hypothetical protein
MDTVVAINQLRYSCRNSGHCVSIRKPAGV